MSTTPMTGENLLRGTRTRTGTKTWGGGGSRSGLPPDLTAPPPNQQSAIAFQFPHLPDEKSEIDRWHPNKDYNRKGVRSTTMPVNLPLPYYGEAVAASWRLLGRMERVKLRVLFPYSLLRDRHEFVPLHLRVALADHHLFPKGYAGGAPVRLSPLPQLLVNLET